MSFNFLETVAMIVAKHLGGEVRFQQVDYGNAMVCRWDCPHGMTHARTAERHPAHSADSVARVVAEELKHSCRVSCEREAAFEAAARWHKDEMMKASFYDAQSLRSAYSDALVSGRGYWREHVLMDEPNKCYVPSIADSIKVLHEAIAKSPKFLNKPRKDRRLLLLRR